MGIEGERAAFPAALEQGERGGVDIAPALVVVALEDLPRPFLRRPIQVDEIDRATVSKAEVKSATPPAIKSVSASRARSCSASEELRSATKALVSTNTDLMSRRDRGPGC